MPFHPPQKQHNELLDILSLALLTRRNKPSFVSSSVLARAEKIFS
jgi:hypothetical protein